MEEPDRPRSSASTARSDTAAGSAPACPASRTARCFFYSTCFPRCVQIEQGGSRIAIVFNGSPLFTGDAGSGESEIRSWIIKHDWLEAIVALPGQLFYNTGIATYVWVLTNRKESRRAGKVQLIDARQMYVKMRKSLGNKRNELSQEQIDDITRIHGNFRDGEARDITDEDPVTHLPRTRVPRSQQGFRQRRLRVPQGNRGTSAAFEL